MVVIPTEFIRELNQLSEEVISSKVAHSYNLSGHINGIDIVTKTDLHVKTVEHKLTPALPALTDPIKSRIGRAISEKLAPRTSEWVTVEPMRVILYCVSLTTSLLTVGAPLCDNSEYTGLIEEQTQNVFMLVVLLRFVPKCLQPLLVWLIPARWRLQEIRKRMRELVLPEVKDRKAGQSTHSVSDMLSWMMMKARHQYEVEPDFLALLQAILSAGAIHTTAMLTFNALFDLVPHPDSLEEIRQEIRDINEQVNGIWDHAAFNRLYKLDSAMKETMRLNPPVLAAYNRVMQQDYTLSNGVTLRRGQMICVSSCSRQKDPAIFPHPEVYDALREYNQDLEAHRARPFKTIDGDALRWGSGRWACPGRFLASLEAKVILVKLLDGFEFKLSEGRTRPSSMTTHEFVFIDEHAQLLVRQRADASDLSY
ncbi:MAG: hypothetical protein M1821_003985 [Bathelium mastoideum]|nr:MAG: hypothetical protein M1821_003985 [Bathelium mastoideum]